MFTVASLTLLSSPAASQAVSRAFCSDPGCIIPVKLTCEEMILQFEFQGGCCSMESIPETRGCRITISGGANCYWYPRCSQTTPTTVTDCQNDQLLRCHTVFETDSTRACPESEFDPFVNITDASTCPPAQAPSPDINGGGNGPTDAPPSGSVTAATPTMIMAIVGCLIMYWM
jgi:hypothetical protein